MGDTGLVDWVDQTPDPTLSLSSAGVGRTGVFITLSIVLERMRYEGVVDMFQTVKTLRTQRPAMVQTEVCKLVVPCKRQVLIQHPGPHSATTGHWLCVWLFWLVLDIAVLMECTVQ